MNNSATRLMGVTVLALGIRGYKKWSEKWVRVYRGMEAEKIQELNEIREIFAEEVRELAQGFGSGKKTAGWGDPGCHGPLSFKDL